MYRSRMISAFTKLHENESPSSEAENGWIWKTIRKNDIPVLPGFPCHIGAGNERNKLAYCILTTLRGTKPSVS